MAGQITFVSFRPTEEFLFIWQTDRKRAAFKNKMLYTFSLRSIWKRSPIDQGVATSKAVLSCHAHQFEWVESVGGAAHPKARVWKKPKQVFHFLYFPI